MACYVHERSELNVAGLDGKYSNLVRSNLNSWRVSGSNGSEGSKG